MPPKINVSGVASVKSVRREKNDAHFIKRIHTFSKSMNSFAAFIKQDQVGNISLVNMDVCLYIDFYQNEVDIT